LHYPNQYRSSILVARQENNILKMYQPTQLRQSIQGELGRTFCTEHHELPNAVAFLPFIQTPKDNLNNLRAVA
jgi:hypothetical protein